MKQITIPISSTDLLRAERVARAYQIGVPSLCGLLLSSRLAEAAKDLDVATPGGEASSGAVPLSVSTQFPDFPPESVRLAQLFADQVSKAAGAVAERQGRSIRFTPRFVFVDYLVSRSSAAPGLVVSLYGRPGDYPEIAERLRRGRSSYVRVRIHSDKDLAAIEPCIRRAYHLRHGHRSEEQL